MKREDLILKWLDNDLNPQELEAFKQLEDYKDLTKLSDSVMGFKASEFNTQEELDILLNTIETTRPLSNKWLKPLLRIAAIFAISFSVYYYTTTLDTTEKALAAHKTTPV